jgi:c-di-GMP-related signal transduction protein
MNEETFLIGKQPILNCQEEIVAFELLFRSQRSGSSAKFDSATQASSRVILNMLSNIGIESLLGKHQGFVNVDLDLLMSDSIELLPKQLVGLELLESIEATPKVVERCRKLKSLGYQLALDDHKYCPSFEPLYNGLIDIIKIDLFTTPLSSLSGVVEQFRRYPVRLLAEKVETRQEFLLCRSLGFELFQGYFFARPTLIQKQRLTSCIQSFLKLMTQLGNDAEISELEGTFKESPVLVYKLLMLVNSVSFGLHDKVRTIRHAITVVGRQQLKRWVQIALFADDGRQDFNNPVMHMAVARANFMEELARAHPHIGDCSPDEAFMAGILSMLKDVYDIVIDNVIAGLNHLEDIEDAVEEERSKINILLCLARMIEKNKLDEAAEYFELLGISLESVFECQKKAFDYHMGLS